MESIVQIKSGSVKFENVDGQEMVLFETTDGREGAEYIDDGKVNTSYESNLHANMRRLFNEDEVYALHKQLEALAA